MSPWERLSSRDSSSRRVRESRLESRSHKTLPDLRTLLALSFTFELVQLLGQKAQMIAHLFGILVARLETLFQRPVKDGHSRLVDLGVMFRGGLWIHRGNLIHNCCQVFTTKGKFASQQLVENNSQRKNIRTAVYLHS